MPKNVPLKGQNHKIASNSATMSIWSLKIGKNMKTNWYKHVIIYISSTLYMSNLTYLGSKCAKVRKIAKNCLETGQNHKIASNSVTMSIWSLKIGKNMKTNCYKHV